MGTEENISAEQRKTLLVELERLAEQSALLENQFKVLVSFHNGVVGGLKKRASELGALQKKIKRVIVLMLF